MEVSGLSPSWKGVCVCERDAAVASFEDASIALMCSNELLTVMLISRQMNGSTQKDTQRLSHGFTGAWLHNDTGFNLCVLSHVSHSPAPSLNSGVL